MCFHFIKQYLSLHYVCKQHVKILMSFLSLIICKNVSNLVTLTQPNLQILRKTQMEVFPISGFLTNPLQSIS